MNNNQNNLDHLQLINLPKGILAADESNSTIEKRFREYEIDNTPENRLNYRLGLLETEGIEKYLSGVILHEETIHQKNYSDQPIAEMLAQKGILAGIKVDLGTDKFEGSEYERITMGLDGLDERLKQFKLMGASFTKWRAVFIIGENTPSEQLIDRNISDLCDYASCVLANGMTPIVEPEVLRDGIHDQTQCRLVTYTVLKRLFTKMSEKNIDASKVVLKPNMITAGADSADSVDPVKSSEDTLSVLESVCPDNLLGVAFLSGGIKPDLSIDILSQIAKNKKTRIPMTFSFARALQIPFLDTWRGDARNLKLAQELFLNQVKKASDAINIGL